MYELLWGIPRHERGGGGVEEGGNGGFRGADASAGNQKAEIATFRDGQVSVSRSEKEAKVPLEADALGDFGEQSRDG